MATGMHMDERSIDCWVLYPNTQDTKVSAKLVTMLGTTFFFKNGCSKLLVTLVLVGSLYMIRVHKL